MTSSEKPEPQGSEPSSTDLRCVCQCLVSQHMGRPTGCREHGFHDFECSHTRCTSETCPDRPKSKAAECRHCFEHTDSRCCHCDALDPKAEPEPKANRWYKWSDGLWRDHSEPEQAAEPPLTPEEEEEAPEDCVCGNPSDPDAKHRTDGPCVMKELPPPEEPEYTPCLNCGHIEPEHAPDAGDCSTCSCDGYCTEPEDEDACNHLYECGHEQGDHSSSGYCKQCDCESSTGHYVTDCPEHVCETYYCPTAGEVESACHGGFDVCCGAPEKHLPADQAPKPPQPERRAPYVATYSVGGHLYEVAVPGDACLQAVDGALVIRHGLGPVAGLVGFQPLTVEEKR